MRSKIRSRQYVNWQEIVRDFELICNNAMKYNQKRSRVHKQVGVPGGSAWDSAAEAAGAAEGRKAHGRLGLPQGLQVT